MSEDILNQDEEVTEASAPVANKGVVTPDKDPVPKSLASVDKAADGTKPSKKRKGDQDKKDGPQKLNAASYKEDADNEEEIVVEDMTKMEALRKIIEELKGLDKEDIQSLVNEMMKKDKEDDEDEDEDEKSESTKADLLKKIAEHFKSEDEEVVKESLTAILEASKEEDDEEDEDEDEQKDEMMKPKKNLKAMNMKGKKEASEDDEDDEDEDEDEKSESYDMSDDIDALVGGEDLSEEFKNKAKVVFEAAVNAKVSEIKEELESQKRDEIVEASNEIKDELVEKVDSFLGYVAEEWVKDNELAIERGLKSELTENFIQGLKGLFEDHYVEVPDDKLDVVDELASKIEEVEAKLNEEVSKNIDLSQERDELVRNKVVSEVSKDLTESEIEKLTRLIEDLDQDEEFESNVQTIKESYFSDSKEKLQLDEEVVSDSDENASTEEKILDPSMAAYSAAIGKIDPNKYK